MPSRICLPLSFSNNCLKQPNVILYLHLLNLPLLKMRLGILVVRLKKIAVPRRGELAPRCRSTMRLLLDRHLVRRRRLVHCPLVLLRLVKIAVPRRGESAPRCRSTMRLLLDHHLVRRRRLVHCPLALLRLVQRRTVVLCVDAVRLVVDEVPRRRLQSPGLFRAVDLLGEASRSAVNVAAGLSWIRYSCSTWFHVDVCNHQVCIERTHCKNHQRASSPLLRVYREEGVSRRRPQGRHLRRHGIRVRCSNNETECSTDN